MDDSLAHLVIDSWSGGSGVVARGPKMLLGMMPATPSDIERHTGRRAFEATKLWKLEVGGRFVASAGVLYPSGVPFPEELHSQTAVIANEVWLYAEDDGTVVGAYWWPDALRRPIASVPRDDFEEDELVHPLDASRRVDVPVPLPDLPPWEPSVAAAPSRDEVIVFCLKGAPPEPLNEMLVYEAGGVSVRATRARQRLDVASLLRNHQPPYRRITVRLCDGIGRDPGRALGPQTWPWPGELTWWHDGVTYEVKGAVPLSTLVEIAESISLSR